jgi:hypothetical protein
MKNIKSFKLFEAIILPKELKSNSDISSISSYDELVQYSNDNEFDVVKYAEFYKSLSDSDKKNAPPKGLPFFALFHPIRKKPMFVISNINVPKVFPNFKTIVDDIIGHERIHSEQSKRKGSIEYILPKPNDRKLYFSNKEEIMAFSYSIAKELIKFGKDSDWEDFNNTLKKRLRWSNLYADIKNYVDIEILNRYRKYIYLYVKELVGQKKRPI